MASLTKNSRSPYWTACFTDAAGKRIQKSTKLTAKKDAQKLAEEWEAAARVAVAPLPPPVVTLRSWCIDWLAINKGTVGIASYLAYSHRSGDLVAHLGLRADAPMDSITKGEIIGYPEIPSSQRDVTEKIIFFLISSTQSVLHSIPSHYTPTPANEKKCNLNSGSYGSGASQGVCRRRAPEPQPADHPPH